ncbi:MAG: lysylphosphatidylglycerol synthase transmembrane domain-containing protein [Thermoplasmatota archaeon]
MDGKRSKKIRRLLTACALILLFIVIVIVLAFAGRDVIGNLRGLDPRFIFVALASYAGVQLAWGIKYYLLVKRKVKRAYFPYVMIANMVGNFVNVTTPSGRLAGEPVRAGAISRRYRSSFGSVFAATMVDKMSLTIAMILILIPLMIYTFITFQVDPLIKYTVIGFIIFWFIIGALLYLLFKYLSESRAAKLGKGIYTTVKFFFKSRIGDRDQFIETIMKGIKDFKESFKSISKNPFYMTIDIILGMLIYGFRFVAAYMFFIAIGHPVDFLIVAIVVHITFIIGLMSQFPGMVGIGETTMTGLYLAMGVNSGAAITVSILTQINMYAFEMGLGYIATVILNLVSLRKPKFLKKD